MKKYLSAILAAFLCLGMSAETVQVGLGSYTTTFPGVDKAGRNSNPTSDIYISGDAVGRPVPSNEWWSPKLITAQPNNLFNYPLGLQVTYAGLGMVKNMEQQALTADQPFTVGVEGVYQDGPTVSAYSDWTVTFTWQNDAGKMEAVIGTATPWVYFTKEGSGDVVIDWRNWGSVQIDGNIATVSGSYNGMSYAAYAPTGATWVNEGGKLRSNLGGKDYWSAVMLPEGTQDAMSVAKQWAKHAFAFPADTRAEWAYDSATGEVVTTYTVTIDAKEAGATAAMGLLPHQWANLKEDVAFDGYKYSTVRGELRMADTGNYSTSLKFHGILPTLPKVEDKDGFSADRLKELAESVIADDGLLDWTDSYNDGQLFNRLLQTGRICAEMGMTEQLNSIVNKLKERLQNWLTYTPGEVAFLFYYYEPWGSLLGYPAGHYQDQNINDHNYHWGYMISAAAFIAQYDPQWIQGWGPMIDLLVRDAASADRDDSLFPYQRSFSPYSGHSWANGTPMGGLGNDQESTSESMMFHAALIQWGEVTGNRSVRDQGIYMYVTELSAAEEYWFDIHHRNLPADYRHHIVSRVFTNGYDSENYWGGGIEGSYGIQIYPITASSFYLVHDPVWAAEHWEAICRDTDILKNVENPNIWYDTYWQLLSMMDPDRAMELYNGYENRTLKFGTSAAQTYQWMHAMQQLGRPDQDMTADYPFAVAFKRDGIVTYAVQNYSDTPITVTFSDGHCMNVAARTLATSKGTYDPATDPDKPGEGGNGNGNGTGDDPNNPDNPDIPDENGCVFTGTTSTQGQDFHGEYYVTCSTVNGDVVVKARFEGSYIGFATAYIWNETNGFAEIAMTSVGEQEFTGRIAGLEVGMTAKFRIKIEFAGGMAVTEQVSYAVGNTCESGINLLRTGFDLNVYPNPASDVLTVKAPVEATTMVVYSASGRKMLERLFDSSATIDVSAWPAGIYFIWVGIEGKELIIR